MFKWRSPCASALGASKATARALRAPVSHMLTVGVAAVLSWLPCTRCCDFLNPGRARSVRLPPQARLDFIAKEFQGAVESRKSPAQDLGSSTTRNEHWRWRPVCVCARVGTQAAHAGTQGGCAHVRPHTSFSAPMAGLHALCATVQTRRTRKQQSGIAQILVLHWCQPEADPKKIQTSRQCPNTPTREQHNS